MLMSFPQTFQYSKITVFIFPCDLPKLGSSHLTESYGSLGTRPSDHMPLGEICLHLTALKAK